MQKIVALCKRRGFIFQGSEIYGGLGGTWDYGPTGSLLKKNFKDWWWEDMVLKRDDIVGVDAAIMMNPKVWEASGHVENFADTLIECKTCHLRFRTDKKVRLKPIASKLDLCAELPIAVGRSSRIVRLVDFIFVILYPVYLRL